MLLNLWMTAQFIVVLLSTDVDALVPQSSSHLTVLVLLGVALLTPLSIFAARAVLRILALVPRGHWPRTARTQIPDYRLPAEPGTPGTALARAPSL